MAQIWRDMARYGEIAGYLGVCVRVRVLGCKWDCGDGLLCGGLSGSSLAGRVARSDHTDTPVGLPRALCGTSVVDARRAVHAS